MFESLSDRLGSVFEKLRGKGALEEKGRQRSPQGGADRASRGGCRPAGRKEFHR